MHILPAIIRFKVVLELSTHDKIEGNKKAGPILSV